jgi:hypothetical protein
LTPAHRGKVWFDSVYSVAVGGREAIMADNMVRLTKAGTPLRGVAQNGTLVRLEKSNGKRTIELRLTPNWCGVAKWNLSEIREK